MKTKLLAAAGLFALTASALPTLALAQSAETQAIYPYLQTVGDLDGDGVTDLVRVSDRAEEPTEDPLPNQLTAYRGSDGAVLWSVEVPTWANTATAAKVGSVGTQGVILSGYLLTRANLFLGGGGYESPFGSFLTGSAQVQTGVIAVSGSGTVLWTRSFEEGTFVYLPPKAYADGLALFSGVLGTTGSSPDNVLISIYDRMPASDGQEDTMQGLVLDGADGSTRSTSTLDVDSTVTEVVPAGDVSGDGQTDYTVELNPYTDENEHSVVAVNGTTGERLWTLPLPSEDFAQQTRLGDVTGDGADDLAFTIDIPSFEPLGDEVYVVDGSNGGVESILVGDVVRSTVDASGDGVRDLLVGYRQQDPQSVVAIYELFRADGHIVRHRSYEIPRGGTGDSVTGQIRASIGDIDDDGIQDLAHTLSAASGGSDARIVSGRDGSTIRTGTLDEPLFASVDGHGDDTAEINPFGQAAVDIIVRDGATGSELWQTRLRPSGETMGSLTLQAADVNGDGRAEVIGKASSTTPGQPLPDGTDLESESFRDIWVLDGRDGSVLWTLS